MSFAEPSSGPGAELSPGRPSHLPCRRCRGLRLTGEPRLRGRHAGSTSLRTVPTQVSVLQGLGVAHEGSSVVPGWMSADGPTIVWCGRLLQRCSEQKDFRDCMGTAPVWYRHFCVDSPIVSRACLRDALLAVSGFRGTCRPPEPSTLQEPGLS